MTAAIQNQGLNLDTKLLSEFVYALNIARRQVLSYPSDHPIVATATAKLIAIVPRLLEFCNHITLGVARDTLLVEGEVLDAANPVFRDLAQNLFNARIASLTISRELTEDDVCRFFNLFNQTPEQLAEAGGIDQLLVASGFCGIKAQGIDFSAFSTTEVDVVHAPKTKGLESDTALLWKSFAKGIVKGSIDPKGVRYLSTGNLDPVLLAEVMNQEQVGADGPLGRSYEEAITTFLQESDQKKIHGRAYQESLGQLGDMVGTLKPELRRQFLNSMLKNCAQRPETAEAILSRMPQTDLINAFEQMDPSTIEIPQTLMDILGKLARSHDEEVSKSRVAGESNRSTEETAEQLATLFSEDRSEYFVPRDYQDALSALTTATVNHTLNKGQVDELVSSLQGHQVEEQFSAVLLDLLDRGVDQPTSDAIGHNVDELVDYFLETGNFTSLTSIYRQLHCHVTAFSTETFDSTRETLERFVSEEFFDTVLEGFDTWGKHVHDPIQALIESVGVPFAGALLERLADEPSMSRRRLLMKCLVRIGPQVKTPITARLSDKRWFFVRNMVVVLREIKDPAVIPLLRRLSGYNHPKVQFEVMNTYLQYGDERANRYLLKELASKNPVSLLSAVRLAANSRNPHVISMLAKLLNVRLPAEHEHEVKSNVIKALHEPATDDILPDLATFLLGKKLFGGNKNLPLKIKAVAILGKIGTVDAGILAGKVAQSSSGELAEISEDVLVKIHRALA